MSHAEEEVRATLKEAFAALLAEVEHMQEIVKREQKARAANTARIKSWESKAKRLFFTLIFCLVTSPVFAKVITLHWQDNSDNENGFRIEVSKDNGKTWGLLTAVGQNITTRTVNAPAGKSRWCFRVRAYNQLGMSDPSQWCDR